MDKLRGQLHDRVDLHAAAAAAAAVLRESLSFAKVSVVRYAPEGDHVVLLASSAVDHEDLPVGARLVPQGALARALREDRTCTAVGLYVEPDFVHSLPGETRSEVAVPIRSETGVCGAIHLEYPAPHIPTEQGSRLTERVAEELSPHLAAAAREPAEAGVESRRPAERTTLSAIAHATAQGEGLATVGQKVVSAAVELTGCVGAALLLHHDSRQGLEVQVVAGEVLPRPGDLLPVDGTLAGSVVREGRSRRSSGRGEGALPEFGTGDTLIVPVVAAGRACGVLAAVHGPDRSFTADDVTLLHDLANLAAPTELLRQVTALRQRLSDGSLISEVGRAVTGTLGLEEVFALVLRAAEMLTGARSAAVALLDERGEALVLQAVSGGLRTSQGQSLPLEGSLIGLAVRSGETVTSPGVAEDERSCELETEAGPGVVVPLESRRRVHGALFVARAASAPVPADQDIDALRKLATYAAIAIDNAQLYREQTLLSEQLRVQARELEQAYRELRESQERLLVSEKMAALGRVTAGIAHEINSPLGGILNCLQMARTYTEEYRASIGDPEVTSEDHQAIAGDLLQTIELAEGATRKVAQFVHSIKSQTRIGEEAELRAFDPAHEIGEMLVVLQHELRNRNVQVHTEVETGLRLTGDPGKFSLVVQNLLTNAVDAYEDQAGDVWVRLQRDGNRVCLQVEDRGCGIPESIRARIFDYLFTTKDIGRGTGLGLSIVHSVIRSHFEGDITVQSEVGRGSTFTVTFPLKGSE